MPSAYSEDQLVEQPAIALFAELGWTTVSALEETYGPSGSLQRATKSEVVLVEVMRDQATPEVQEIVSKRFFGRRGSGEITPQHTYCQPLLEVLVEMGGGGRTRDVLDRLGKKMEGTLKPKDYEPHKSDAHQIRWRNTGQWARNQMVNEDGRMKKGSRRVCPKNWDLRNCDRTSCDRERLGGLGRGDERGEKPVI